jgi:hypothetical protein
MGSNLAAARCVQNAQGPEKLEIAVTRTMLRDALSALAAVTLVTAGANSAASAQSKHIKAFQAEVAMDAVRGAKPKAPKLAAPPRQTANGQDWRWFQDYGGAKLSQPSVQKELSLSDDQ